MEYALLDSPKRNQTVLAIAWIWEMEGIVSGNGRCLPTAKLDFCGENNKGGERGRGAQNSWSQSKSRKYDVGKGSSPYCSARRTGQVEMSAKAEEVKDLKGVHASFGLLRGSPQAR